MLKTESCIFGIASPHWEHDRNAVDSRNQQTSLIWPIDSIKNRTVTLVHHMHIILREFCTKSTKWPRNLTHHCNCESLLQTRKMGHSYRWWEENLAAWKLNRIMSSFTFGASIMMAVLAAPQGPGSFSGSRQGCQHLQMLQDMEILQIPHLWLTLHTCVATDCIRCQCCVRWLVWWGLWLGFPRVSLWSIRRAIALVLLLLLREFLVVVFLMERRRSFHRNARSGLCVHGNNNFWMLVFLRPHV